MCIQEEEEFLPFWGEVRREPQNVAPRLSVKLRALG